jgi:hypothetical protein
MTSRIDTAQGRQWSNAPRVLRASHPTPVISRVPLHYIVLLYPAVALTPIQDFVWRGTAAGFFGAAPAGFLFTAFILFDGIHRIRNENAYPGAALKVGLICGLILVGVAVGLAWITAQFNPAALFERFGYKSLTTAVLQGTFLYPALCPPRMTRGLLISTGISIAIAISGFLLVDVLSLQQFTYPSLFHYTPAITSPRGFGLERSTFASTTPTAILLLACLTKTAPLRLTIGLSALFVAVLAGSKGSIATTLLVAGYMILMNRRIPVSLKIMSLAVVPLAVFAFVEVFLNRITTEAVQYTSVGTRSLYALLSIISLPEHPFGVGFAGFVPFFLDIGPHIQDLAQVLHLSSRQLLEVWSYYVAGSGYNAGTKTQFGDMLLIWGVPGAVAVLAYLWRPIAALFKVRDTTSGAAFLFTALSLIFYVPGMTLYILPIAMGVAREHLLGADQD